MAKYRKKPVVIDAEQFYADAPYPPGVCRCQVAAGPAHDGRPHVHTMHAGQPVVLEDGDWIIPEPDGEHFYPCKPDVFAATYEAVEP